MAKIIKCYTCGQPFLAYGSIDAREDETCSACLREADGLPPDDGPLDWVDIYEPLTPAPVND